MQPAPSVDRSAAPGSPSASPSADGRFLFADDDGLSIMVELDSDLVAPGGTLVVTATVRNNRPRDVTLGGGWCGEPVDVTARFAIPTEPVGRAWAGIEGAWKEFVRTRAFAPGGGPADEALTVHGRTGPGCDPVERVLGPGETLTITSRLSAEIVNGIPALPGEVPLEITLLHDPVDSPLVSPPAGGAEPPPVSPPAGGAEPPRLPGLRIGPTWRQFDLRTSVRVDGDARHVLSIGETADAMLGDRRFATWLATMPARTWDVSNVFLQNNGKAEGIVPAGPSWEVDLFREAGVPRNWAIGFVDPFTGKVLNLAFCDVPCDR
jgi:hypothetical protein